PRRSPLWSAFHHTARRCRIVHPGNVGKHSAKRRAHKLFLANHTLHKRRNLLCPSNGFTCHARKCSCRADNGYHGSSPSKQTDQRLSPTSATPPATPSLPSDRAYRTPQ